MTHCQTWDIDKYRSEHEPKHQWQLKKKFMEHHKDRFPENELVRTVLLITLVNNRLQSNHLPPGMKGRVLP